MDWEQRDLIAERGRWGLGGGSDLRGLAGLWLWVWGRCGGGGSDKRAKGGQGGTGIGRTLNPNRHKKTRLLGGLVRGVSGGLKCRAVCNKRWSNQPAKRFRPTTFSNPSTSEACLRSRWTQWGLGLQTYAFRKERGFRHLAKATNKTNRLVPAYRN